VPFNQEKVLEDVRRVLKREKYCLIVVAEGLVDADGNYLAADAATDAFGHAKLGGAGEALSEIIETPIFRAIKVRVARPGSSSAPRRMRVQDRCRRGLPRRPGGGARRVAGETDKMVTLRSRRPTTTPARPASRP
jgi:hypothetical protein